MVLFAFPFCVSSRAFLSPPRPNEHLMVRSFDDDDNRNERGGGKGGGGAKQMVSHKSEEDKEKNERKQICVCRCDGFFRKQGEGCLTLFVAWVGGTRFVLIAASVSSTKKGKKLQQETEKWQLFFVSLLSLSHLFLRTFANHHPPPCGRRGGKNCRYRPHQRAKKKIPI